MVEATRSPKLQDIFPTFPNCLQEIVASQHQRHVGNLDPKLCNMFVMPMLLTRSYKSIVAYGNHFKVNIWHGTSSLITYDVGVMAEFEYLPHVTQKNLDP